jgi:hypothetical protein
MEVPINKQAEVGKAICETVLKKILTDNAERRRGLKTF